MIVDGQSHRRYTETDEVSVIARGRACVRTEQYRHSEVMRSVGRSHIQRCERAAVAQAMTHATTWSRNPILVLGRDRSSGVLWALVNVARVVYRNRLGHGRPSDFTRDACRHRAV